MMQSPSDNEPLSPFDDRPISAAREILPDDDDAPLGGSSSGDDGPPAGPGCGMQTLVLLVLVAFALVIVVLAGVAGWTTGQREANVYATATRGASIAEQMGRIPADVANGNTVLLDTRIRYLATLTPGVPGLADIALTATALYDSLLPTATFTPSPTLPVPPTAEPALTEAPPPATASAGGYDLSALLQEAQASFNTAQYGDAAELLDVIAALDPDYETATVRALLTDSLNAQARAYYQAMQPAAGNDMVSRIEALGLPLGDGLAYERDVGIVYLNAKSSIGVNFPRAIAALEELIGYGQGRYYSEATQLLLDQYIAYGDALAFDPNAGPCQAVSIYQQAVNRFGSGAAAQKLTTAETLCATQPTTDPMFGQAGAPMGVVATPGSP
jgi:tetratricopeptide (TPR) repeat protein